MELTWQNPMIPLALAVLLYLWVAYGYSTRSAYGTAFAWLAYALANVGFIVALVLKEIK